MLNAYFFMVQSIFHGSELKAFVDSEFGEILKSGNKDTFVFSGFTHRLWLV